MSIKFEVPRRVSWSLRVDADVDECRVRLDAVTSAKGHSYYLNPSHAGKPAPVLRGVDKPRYPVQVARWESTLGRDSFVAWLCARLVPDEGGGAVLSGWVGTDPRFPLGQWLFLGGTGLVIASLVIAGIWGALSGHPAALLFSAAGLAWTVVIATVLTFGARHCRQDGALLRADVRAILSGMARDARDGRPTAL